MTSSVAVNAGITLAVVVLVAGCSQGPTAAPGAPRTVCEEKTPKTVTPRALKAIVDAHRLWLETENDPTGRKGRQADLRHADLRRAQLPQVDLSDADLSHAILNGANASRARLFRATLVCTKLNGAILKGARLDKATLRGASLLRTDLTDASLFDADLRDSNLWQTILIRADLDSARFGGAQLIHTNLDGARLYHADLGDAVYRPANAPAPGYSATLRGVARIRLDEPDFSGLAQLRSALKSAGLYDLEREVTLAIERWRTAFLVANRSDSLLERWWEWSRGWLRWVFFDLTTAYGRHPERALWLVALLWAGAATVYVWPLSRPPAPGSAPSGIFITRPATRLMRTGGGFVEVGTVAVERMRPASWLGRLWWAAYYSLLSLLSIGFREFNFQSWLARLQRQEATYHAAGWVRVVAGAQSLAGLYLVAIFVLTYFGRPFD